MADKKITALTALTATTKDSDLDLLHIIDYSAAPVNKKITVAELFSNVNTSTHIYGQSKTFELGSTSTSSSAFKVTTSAGTNGATGTAAANHHNVIINDDKDQYVDFTVKTVSSEKAIHVDSSYVSGSSGPCIVFINNELLATPPSIFNCGCSEISFIGNSTTINIHFQISTVSGNCYMIPSINRIRPTICNGFTSVATIPHKCQNISIFL